MNLCKNCHAQLDASFCPQCGQKDIELQRPLLALLGEVFQETLDVDGRAARTIWTMFTQPGELTTRYLAGQRQLYTPPVRLYVVVSLLFFVVVAWVVRQGILFDVNADSAGEVRVLSEDLPRLMFLFLPVFALLLKAAFRRRYYFDHLIHALHLHTAAYVVMALMLPLEQAADRHWSLLILQICLFAYLAAYLAISLRRVYGETWVGTAIKTFVLVFGYSTVLAFSLEFASNFSMPAGD